MFALILVTTSSHRHISSDKAGVSTTSSKSPSLCAIISMSQKASTRVRGLEKKSERECSCYASITEKDIYRKKKKKNKYIHVSSTNIPYRKCILPSSREMWYLWVRYVLNFFSGFLTFFLNISYVIPNAQKQNHHALYYEIEKNMRQCKKNMLLLCKIWFFFVPL